MTVKQTRCPFCHSAFYITSLQLNAYRGQARCGQCHQIFDATGNMTGNTPAPSPAQPIVDEQQTLAATPEVTAPLENTINTRLPTAHSASAHSPSTHASSATTDENLLFSDDVGIESVVKENIATSGMPTKDIDTNITDLDATSTHLSANTNHAAKPSITKSSSAILTATNVSEDEALLFSDEVGFPDEEAINANNAKPSGVVLDGTFDQHFLDDTFDQLDVLGQHELTGVEKLHKAADDSWLEDLLAEEDVPEIEQEQVIDPKLNKRPASINSSAAQIAEALAQRASPDHDEDLLSFLNRTGAVTMPSAQVDKSGYSPNARPASHRILKPTPVESNPAHFVGWSLMSLMMLFLLVGQYIYFNFEEMSMNPKTSGYLTKACAVFGCQLPYMNADEIFVKNIRLTSNNKMSQTTFKAQITNDAKLSQPFPALRLTLQQDGKTVASQIIQPRQYLPNELKTLARLASKNRYPVQFTINTKRSDIKDFKLEAQYH